MKKQFTFYPIMYMGVERCATITVELKQNSKGLLVLSMVGRFAGSGGQIYSTIMEAYNSVPKQKGFQLLSRLCAVGERWHLNDMRAGTPKQMAALREARKKGFNGEYREQLKYLEERGLSVDNGYTYGNSWLYEELPANVLLFIKQLLGIPVDIKKHISFTRYGDGTTYASNVTDSSGKPQYLICKGKNGAGWSVLVRLNGEYLPWCPKRNVDGWDGTTCGFSTLNAARSAVNL